MHSKIPDISEHPVDVATDAGRMIEEAADVTGNVYVLLGTSLANLALQKLIGDRKWPHKR